LKAFVAVRKGWSSFEGAGVEGGGVGVGPRRC